MVSYALFRVVFSQGLSIPIKREGMVDMDVTVQGKEITINTNQLFFSVPELNVWHIVYEHKGKPILELGRGSRTEWSSPSRPKARIGDVERLEEDEQTEAQADQGSGQENPP